MAAAASPAASTRMYQGNLSGLTVMSLTSASPCAAEMRPSVTARRVTSSSSRAWRSMVASRVCSRRVCIFAP